MEQFLDDKANAINEKRAKRENPIYFLKDLVDYSEMLVENGYDKEAEYVFSEAVNAYLHHSFDVMILFHVYADFGIADRILALSDRIYGKESEQSFGVIYYRAIDMVDSGNRTDEVAVYEEALEDLNSRKSGFVEEKLKIYRRYTSALRRDERGDEAMEIEFKLVKFKEDGNWPMA